MASLAGDWDRGCLLLYGIGRKEGQERIDSVE